MLWCSPRPGVALNYVTPDQGFVDLFTRFKLLPYKFKF